MEVTYDADGMLERNRDNLSGNLIECVSNSGNEFVKALTTSQMPETGSISRSMGALKVRGSLPEISGELKRSESRNSISKYQAKKLQHRSRSVGSLAGTELKQSSFVSRNFRRSLSELMQKVSHSKPTFVRCLKPNISKSPTDFDVDVVKNQMQCNGLLEIAKIRRDGYAVRMPFPEFVYRYRDISFGRDEIVKPDLKICEQILVDSGIKGYALGKTKEIL
ncbi:hypothetical protein KUTeg_017539 [Tegillarca granosa]|uniref:Myosin motor domain-containing protein n=1 Tax=Tegillarca granosa TaxID=220873 RepID=A0ABQ9EJ93_TEGGR|nr:hypothetical protein KUTeg_017539 [Tegillarca granosa]